MKERRGGGTGKAEEKNRRPEQGKLLTDPDYRSSLRVFIMMTQAGSSRRGHPPTANPRVTALLTSAA